MLQSAVPFFFFPQLQCVFTWLYLTVVFCWLLFRWMIQKQALRKKHYSVATLKWKVGLKIITGSLPSSTSPIFGSWTTLVDWKLWLQKNITASSLSKCFSFACLTLILFGTCKTYLYCYNSLYCPSLFFIHSYVFSLSPLDAGSEMPRYIWVGGHLPTQQYQV